MTSATIFPGQGSQSVGMLGALAAEYYCVRATLAEASDVLGYDVAGLMADGPAETLNNTEYTQPIMLAADVATWQAWQTAGGAPPTLAAGHSLGEYAALVAAGAISFDDALRLVRQRAQAMQRAVAGEDVAMAAVIGLGDETVIEVCRRATETVQNGRAVSAANFNAPLQVVIAGHADAVSAAGDLAKQSGARLVKPIAVSVPAHCGLMKSAERALSECLSAIDIHPPRFPILHNVDGEPRSDPDAIRAVLVRQLSCPVHWTRSIAAMRDRGADWFVECGPGTVLSGLNKRIDKTIRSVSLAEPGSFSDALDRAA